MACTAPGHEDKTEHGRSGLCQACYRKQRRRALDPAVGTRKPGPKPDPTAPRSRHAEVRRPNNAPEPKVRLSPQEKAARAAERKAAKTHCVHGHELTEQTTYTTAKGQKVCRVCQRAAAQQYHGRVVTPDTVPIGPRNAEKTHCKWGHEFSVHGYVKIDGSRGCKPCHREHTLMRTYGLARGEYDRRFAEQDGACRICSTVLDEGNLHVDHDHGTGAVRGLLCTKCNRGLGHFDDDPERMENGAAYIRKHRAQADRA